jgi:hypothetical protein
MFKGKVLLFSLLLMFATSAYAGDVDDCLSECGTSCEPMIIPTCPAGDFAPISEGCGGTEDYIWVVIKDGLGNGVANIPWYDYWMDACDPAQELCLCSPPLNADSLTNEDGRTTFSSEIAAGDCVLSGGIWISCQGKMILADPPDCTAGDPICLNIIILTPELTGECIVDLSDLGVFGDSYNRAPPDPLYDPCCDYTGDNICDLSDFAFFGEHYQHICF